MNLSTVICCYNSSSRIENNLEYLAKQKLKDLSCEVILVDNNYSDATVEVAKKKWKDCGNPFPLKIIEENEEETIFPNMQTNISFCQSYFQFMLKLQFI